MFHYRRRLQREISIIPFHSPHGINFIRIRETGINTINILNYCEKNNASLIAIDPEPKFDIYGIMEKYNCKFEFYQDISLKILPKLDNFDLVLIDGDHNWYTVYNELKIIEKKFNQDNFPLIFLHDTSWPYGRRDLYYNPELIPTEFKHDYKMLGMIPNNVNLVNKGGLNNNLYNASVEGSEKNGVLTAIEDFMGETCLKLSFYSIPIFHGFGIICSSNTNIKDIVDNLDYSSIMYDLEIYYLKKMISWKDSLVSDIGEKDKLIEVLGSEKDSLVSDIGEKDNIIKELLNEKIKLNNKVNKFEERINYLAHENKELNILKKNNESIIKNLRDENFILSTTIKKYESYNTFKFNKYLNDILNRNK